MSIETLTLLGSLDESVQQVRAAVGGLQKYCSTIRCDEVNGELKVALVLLDGRTIWGETATIPSSDILSSLGTTAKSRLALESGSRRSSTETAIIFALPAFLMISGFSVGLIDPQRDMTIVTQVEEWNQISISEMMKDSKITRTEASEFYSGVVKELKLGKRRAS